MAITTTTITYRPLPVARRPSPIAHNTNTNGGGDSGNTPQPWHGRVAAPRPARPTTMPTTTTPSPVTRCLSPVTRTHHPQQPLPNTPWGYVSRSTRTLPRTVP